MVNAATVTDPPRLGGAVAVANDAFLLRSAFAPVHWSRNWVIEIPWLTCCYR
jgi:hypothetical protein